MSECKQLNEHDLFGNECGENNLHDLVQKFRNQVMCTKGLNPSSTFDIASLEPSDFVTHLKSVENCNDDQSRKIKQWYKICLSPSMTI